MSIELRPDHNGKQMLFINGERMPHVLGIVGTADSFIVTILCDDTPLQGYLLGELAHYSRKTTVSDHYDDTAVWLFELHCAPSTCDCGATKAGTTHASWCSTATAP